METGRALRSQCFLTMQMMICESHDPSAAYSNQQTGGGEQACHPNMHHKAGGQRRGARVEKEVEGRWGGRCIGVK